MSKIEPITSKFLDTVANASLVPISDDMHWILYAFNVVGIYGDATEEEIDAFFVALDAMES